ncbi:MAG: HTTM domain-containing protein, partial [Pirellulales bacterium]
MTRRQMNPSQQEQTFGARQGADSGTGNVKPRAGSAEGGRGWASLREQLAAPVDAASLVFFRIAFGAVMLWTAVAHLSNDWVESKFLAPAFLFKYYAFEWVRPWPGVGLYVHFVVMGVLACCVLAGLWYRASVALLFVAWTYVFLLDQSLFLNHHYLMCLLSFLMLFVPAHRCLGVDARRRPWLRADTVPAWSLWLVRAQLAIVYVYGGLTKIDADWLRGAPMRQVLEGHKDLPLLGGLFTQEWFVYGTSYGALLLDLFIVPLLLWRPTRAAAFVAALVFHLSNAYLFPIGVFPWLMIAATTLFFPPDWPRRTLAAVPQLGRFVRPGRTAR